MPGNPPTPPPPSVTDWLAWIFAEEQKQTSLLQKLIASLYDHSAAVAPDPGID